MKPKNLAVKQWKQQRAKDRREARGRETQSLMQVKCRQAKKGKPSPEEKSLTLWSVSDSPLNSTSPKYGKSSEV